MKGVILETRLVPKTAVANSLTVISAGKVLDARQGKVLDGKIDAMSAQMLAVTIPSGQWSGSGSDYYFSVTASNVTANSILLPYFDNASEALLNGPIWCVPAAGSFTIHTSAIPAGTVNVLVLLQGTLGEAQYQVLADVYSTSQVDSIVAQSTAKIAWSVTTIAQLESAIVTLGSTLTDRGSMVGCAYTNFADATLGFNGSICECTIQRNANGVYLATFITTASDVITDYYYSNAHHWYSSKQSTAKEVTAGLTAAANVTINNQYKVVSGPIRVYAIVFTASANITRDTALISGFDTQLLGVNGATNFIMFNNGTHAEHTCFLHGDGTLRCNDTINANETLRGTLVYIAT